MEVLDIIDNEKSLPWIAPLLCLLAAWLIDLCLLLTLKPSKAYIGIQLATIVGLIGALYTTALLLQQLPAGSVMPLFNGLLQLNCTTLNAHILLVGSTLLLVLPTSLDLSTTAIQGPLYRPMMLAILLSAYLLSAANHWIMAYLSLVGMTLGAVPLLTGNQESGSRRAVCRQYVLYSILASTLMVGGLSYIYGAVGGLQVDQGILSFHTPPSSWFLYSQALGLCLALGGLLMAIGSFPFQFWVSKVYTEIGCREAAYLSTIPKIAIISFLIRLHGTIPVIFPPTWGTFLQSLWAMIALFTMILGHLIALQAVDAKRLLAGGTIAQTGFVCAALVLQTGTYAHISYYMTIYSIMNLAAWLCLQDFSRVSNSFDLQDYAGLGWKLPIQGLCYGWITMSLIGLPPTAGFIAKLLILLPLWDGLQYTPTPILSMLLATVGMGMVMSLYYYLKILYQLFAVKPTISLSLSKLDWSAYRIIILAILLVVLFFNNKLFAYFVQQ